jgi:heptosyltransferase-2
MTGASRPTPRSHAAPARPLRLLVVLPSWVGDVVMATPALRLLREALRGSFIGALCRPGIDELLAGTRLMDELHVDRARGIMGPKLVASKIRPRKYDTALLLTNSFSTALIARLAFIRRRIGYDRDGRGLLLTDRLDAPRRARPHRGWAPVPAVEYYLRAARVALSYDVAEDERTLARLERLPARLELATTREQEMAADDMLARVNISSHVRYAVLNPGANDDAKRWPLERFAEVGRHLRERGLAVAINGGPDEKELARWLADRIGASDSSPAGGAGGGVACLPELGVTIGSLKAVVRRAAIMVTNDTGPRHIAAAFGVPTVALFGPTDPRWTLLPEESGGGAGGGGGGPREIRIVADPTLPESEVADDHPQRCRIELIQTGQVIAAVNRLLDAKR